MTDVVAASPDELEAAQETLAFASAIGGALIGGMAAFLAQFFAQNKILRREKLFYTLQRLERAQLASQRLSSMWHAKIALFHQKAMNEPFHYLSESQHPGDNKYEMQFLVQAFLTDKLKPQLEQVDIHHKTLKDTFNKFDEEIRNKAVSLSRERRLKYPHGGPPVSFGEDDLEFSQTYEKAIQFVEKLDEAITDFKDALLREITALK